MSYWYTRMAEIREKHGMQQTDLARAIDRDASSISRYEAGKVKTLSRSLKKDLLGIFSNEEVSYIEHGAWGMAGDVVNAYGKNSVGKINKVKGNVNSGDVVRSSYDNDIQLVINLMIEMSHEQRMEVFKSAYEIYMEGKL